MKNLNKVKGLVLGYGMCMLVVSCTSNDENQVSDNVSELQSIEKDTLEEIPW